MKDYNEEKFYDEVIHPMIVEVKAKCEERDLPCVFAVAYKGKSKKPDNTFSIVMAGSGGKDGRFVVPFLELRERITTGCKGMINLQGGIKREGGKDIH